MRSCGGSSVMSSPKKWIRPAVGGKSPVTALKSVVLPAPFDPRIAYFWPAATFSDTSSTARSSPKDRVTPLRVSASPDSSWLPARAIGPAAALRRGSSVLSEVIEAMSCCRVASLLAAIWNVACAQAHLLELRFGQAEGLRDV